MTEHFSPKSQRSLPLTLHRALSKVKGKSLRSFCLVTCYKGGVSSKGPEATSTPLSICPDLLKPLPCSCILAGGPLPPPPPSLVPTAPQGLGRHPLLGGGVWWGSLKLGLSLCTPSQVRGFLRVWGPFGSQGGVGGVLWRTGPASRDASPLGTYLFLTASHSPNQKAHQGRRSPAW